MTAPAHLPVLKAQQSETQSKSFEHGPVMNWLPLRGRTEAEARRAKLATKKAAESLTMFTKYS
jgi:hypothetical protein